MKYQPIIKNGLCLTSVVIKACLRVVKTYYPAQYIWYILDK